MFVGHFAVALAAKRAAPQVSLGWWVLAAQWADLVWPVFVVLGLESVRVEPGNTVVTPLAFDSYPYSHSLLMLAVWGAGVGGAYFLLRRDRIAACWLAVVVLSHWVLDWVSHRADMPLAPGGDTLVGLGLWNSVPATMIVELLMFAAGIAIFLRARPPLRRGARLSFVLWAGLLFVIYLGAVFGPPPPSGTAAAVSVFGIWLFVFWAFRLDRIPAR